MKINSNNILDGKRFNCTKKSIEHSLNEIYFGQCFKIASTKSANYKKPQIYQTTIKCSFKYVLSLKEAISLVINI